jgi:uncharacterized membrane protein
MGMIIKSYVIATCVFFGLDMLWLGLIAKNFYREQIGHLMRDSINWPAAILFYLLFIGGIIYFSVYPALRQDSLKVALVNGVLFGFFTYMTYDLTSLAIIREWPVPIVFVDIIWGMVLSGSVSVVTYLITQKIS